MDTLPVFYSEIQEEATAEAEAGATSSSVEAEASSSSAPVCADETPSSPKVVVVEADRASQVSGSGCTSQASVDDDDDVPITEIYLVSPNESTHYSRTSSHYV